MKQISVGKFKDRCLRIMDTVARTQNPIIVATVRHHGGKRITKDKAIRGYPQVKSEWYAMPWD
jgi:hypothetical protein